ncbi:MAG: hypothetical protein V7603_521 [Micromonosporaceae bacterium]
MGPCPVCGNTTVDAAGYCTRCRTYRGQPQQALPTSGAPYPAAPYPPSAAPYPPPSGGPGYPPSYPTQPAGAPPGYPTQPAGVAGYPAAPPGYPGFPAPPPPARRSSFAALIAVAAAAVVLVAAIIVVIVVKSTKDTRTTGTGDASPLASLSASTLVDPCVVGTWKVTSAQRVVDFGGTYGKIKVTSADTYTMKLRADGTGVEDLGDATAFQSVANSTIYTVAVNGTDSYGFRTSGGTLTYSGAVAKGHWVALVNDKTVTSGTTDGIFGSDPVQYTCSGDAMTEQRGDDYSAQMTRTSHTA